jgi:hypothetical protein
MIAIHKDKSFKVKVSELGKDTFKGSVIESDMKVYQLNYYGITWNKQAFDFYTDDEVKEEVKTSDLTAPKHYDNSKGSLYKFSNDFGLNSYEFDIIKRVVRCRKKGNFKEDLEKTKFLIDLYLKEYEI